MNFSLESISFIFLSYFLVSGCSKDSGSAIPSAGTTANITQITSGTAICGGTIKSGGPEVLEKGVCWGTSTKPLYTVNFTSEGPGSGTFSSSITGLTASTKYYVRMYASTEDGTTYGNEKSFTTKAGGSDQDPVLTTALITGETSTTAETGGVISSKGASDITLRGVCWSTSSGPTTSDDKTEDGLGVGTFTSSITGLTASTKYYVRAYAKNDEGTGYGSERSFTTLAGGASQTPVLTTTTQTSVTSTTASSGGVISSDGGSSITSRGVCWSTTPNPTKSNSKTSDGTGTGTFSSSITGLTANTKYYVRAYASTINGTGYGSEISFTSTPGGSNLNLKCGPSLPPLSSPFQCISASGASTPTTFNIPELYGSWDSDNFDFCVKYNSNGTGEIKYKPSGFSAGSSQSIRWGAMVNSKGELVLSTAGTIYIAHESLTSTAVDPQIVLLSFKQSTKQWFGFDLVSVTNCP